MTFWKWYGSGIKHLFWKEGWIFHVLAGTIFSLR